MAETERTSSEVRKTLGREIAEQRMAAGAEPDPAVRVRREENAAVRAEIADEEAAAISAETAESCGAGLSLRNRSHCPTHSNNM